MYIDGRLYYHKIIDLKNQQEGIQELRYIDAMKMRYIRQQKKKEKSEYDRVMSKNLRDQNPMDYDFPELEEYLSLIHISEPTRPY